MDEIRLSDDGVVVLRPSRREHAAAVFEACQDAVGAPHFPAAAVHMDAIRSTCDESLFCIRADPGLTSEGSPSGLMRQRHPV